MTSGEHDPQGDPAHQAAGLDGDLQQPAPRPRLGERLLAGYRALTRTRLEKSTWRIRLDFDSWIARMRTPADNVRAIRALQDAASAEARAHFAIEPDGSFMLDVILFEATAA